MKNRKTLQLVLREIIYLLCLSVFVYKAIVIFLHYSDMQFAWIQAIGYTAGAVLIFTFAITNLVIYLRHRKQKPAEELRPQEHEHFS